MTQQTALLVLAVHISYHVLILFCSVLFLL